MNMNTDTTPFDYDGRTGVSTTTFSSVSTAVAEDPMFNFLRTFVADTVKSEGLSALCVDQLTRSFCTEPGGITKDVIAINESFRRMTTTRSRDHRLSVQIPFPLDDHELTLLKETFPEVVFTRPASRNRVSDNTSSHALAMAARYVWTDVIMNILPRDETVIDVGGNFLTHIKRARGNVHCCMPTDEIRDMVRANQRHKEIQAMARNPNYKGAGKTLALDYLRDSTKYVCGYRSEHCDVQARVMVSIHSSYDIQLKTWADIMSVHGTEILHGTMILPFEAQNDERGFIRHLGCHFVVDRDRNRISFYFDGDSSLNYTHDYREYCRYFAPAVLESSGDYFFYNPVRNDYGTQYFTIMRLPKEVVPRRALKVGSCTYSLGDPDAYVVTTYRLREHYRGERLEDLLPVRFQVPVYVWDMTLSQAVSHGLTGLCRESIAQFLRSANYVTKINGVVVTTKHRLDVEHFHDCVNALYFVALDLLLRYSTTVGQQLRDLQAVQALAGSAGVFERMSTVVKLLFDAEIRNHYFRGKPTLQDAQINDSDGGWWSRAKVWLTDYLKRPTSTRHIAFMSLDQLVHYEFSCSVNDCTVQQIDVPVRVPACAVEDGPSIKILRRHLAPPAVELDDPVLREILDEEGLPDDLTDEEYAEMIEMRDAALQERDAQYDAYVRTFSGEGMDVNNPPPLTNVVHIADGIQPVPKHPAADVVAGPIDIDRVVATVDVADPVSVSPDQSPSTICFGEVSVDVTPDVVAETREWWYHPDDNSDVASNWADMSVDDNGDQYSDEPSTLSSPIYEHHGNDHSVIACNPAALMQKRLEPIRANFISPAALEERMDLIRNGRMPDPADCPLKREFLRKAARANSDHIARAAAALEFVGYKRTEGRAAFFETIRVLTHFYDRRGVVDIARLKLAALEKDAPNFLTYSCNDDGSYTVNGSVLDSAIVYSAAIDPENGECPVITLVPPKNTDRSNFTSSRGLVLSQAPRGRYLFVCAHTVVFNAGALADTVGRIPFAHFKRSPPLTLIEGVPGAGKTYEIVHRFSHDETVNGVKACDQVLCETRSTAEETRRDLVKRFHEYPGIENAVRGWVRTGDSFLLHGAPRRRRAVRHLYIDEALMAHSGALRAMIALAKPLGQVYVFGDRMQIGFTNRTNLATVHAALEPSALAANEYRSVSYRCPQDVASTLRRFYQRGFTTKSKVERSLTWCQVEDAASIDISTCDAVLAFTQEDKATMMRLIKARGRHHQLKVMGVDEMCAALANATVHESQGRTFKHVVLVRLTSKDNDLFDKVNYCIVALTRHRHSLCYYTFYKKKELLKTLINDAAV